MGRICTTAWYETQNVADAGARVHVIAGDLVRPFHGNVQVQTTFSWRRFRLPYRILGTRRMCILHDLIVARKLLRIGDCIDIAHVWPLGALRTLQTARKLGIPTLLERPNAHTRFAYEVVRDECKNLGVSMPEGHEHAYNSVLLEHEEREYALADRLLCPSDFVAKTFEERGFPKDKLARHQYGFDEKVFHSRGRRVNPNGGLKILFVGGCAPRKGLHYGLEAWLRSSAQKTGTFSIAGAFLPDYQKLLSKQLIHPSVRILGHRTDIPELMREHDILILPSIEEGSALVTSEARGCGCVLLVSDAAGAICRHGIDALVHSARDVATLTNHIEMLHQDRSLLWQLQQASLATISEATWKAAGQKLLSVAVETVNAFRNSMSGRIL